MTRSANNNLIAGFAAILLVIAATWRPPVPEPWIGFELIFQFSVISLLAVTLWTGDIRSFGVTAGCKWWAMFLMLAFVSRVIAFYTLGKFSIVSYIALFSVFCGVLWFFLLVLFVDSGAGVKHLMDAICVIALFNLLFLVLQYFKADLLWHPMDGDSTTTHFVGLMSDINNASALLAFCVPAFLRPGWIWLSILPIIGLVTISCCGGPTALAAGLVFYALLVCSMWYKVIVTCLIAVSLLAFFWFVDNPGFSKESFRFNAAKQGIELSNQYPFFGVGLGQWKVVTLRQAIEDNSGFWVFHTHNEYIQMLCELGRGFILILGGYLISIACRITRRTAIPLTALVIILVNCLVNFPFHVATTAIIAITWLAILEVSLREAIQGDKRIFNQLIV